MSAEVSPSDTTGSSISAGQSSNAPQPQHYFYASNDARVVNTSSAPSIPNRGPDTRRRAPMEPPFASAVSASGVPLPDELRQILSQLAIKGECVLPWHVPTAPLDDAKPSAMRSPERPAGRPASNNLSAANPRNRPSLAYGGSPPPPPSAGNKRQPRNGMHHRSLPPGSGGGGVVVGPRKRSHFAMSGNAAASAPNASGSEQEEVHYYESDSTSVSERSSEQRDKHRTQISIRKQRTSIHEGMMLQAASSQYRGTTTPPSLRPRYDSIQKVLHDGISMVLEHYYARGGYKLSPAERQIHVEPRHIGTDEQQLSDGKDKAQNTRKSAAVVFQLRKKSLLDRVILQHDTKSAPDSSNSVRDDGNETPETAATNGPPFTVQRIAEVLVAPERCYTQTHKLCNCLEKLLLVSSSATAFGGTRGGDTSQSRLEDRESMALAHEQGRIQEEFRQRRRRRASQASEGLRHADVGLMEEMEMGTDAGDSSTSSTKSSLPEPMTTPVRSNAHVGDLLLHDTHRGELEASARAALRIKFDHAIGNNGPGSPPGRERLLAEQRGLTGSPPPPHLSSGAAAAAAPVPGGGSLMKHIRDHDHAIVRPLSPIFQLSSEPGSPPSVRERHHHHYHHHGKSSPSSLGLHVPSMQLGSGGIAHTGVSGTPIDVLRITNEGVAAHKDGGSDYSPASSDVDSESDSFDDSASDRSDGSDVGAGSSDYNHSAAVRQLVLKNRLQQQAAQQQRSSSAQPSTSWAAATSATTIASPSKRSTPSPPQKTAEDGHDGSTSDAFAD